MPLRLLALTLLAALITGCGATPSTASLDPTQPVLPTATPRPPTATPRPPTATPRPPTATAVPASDPVRLVIPAIGLDRRLVPVGLDRQRVPIVPDHDVAWYNLSARPGEGENVVLWGHVLRFKSTPNIPAPFARLKELPVGARLTLHGADGVAHAYVVVEQVFVTPDEVKYILPRGRELVTLVSCIGDKVLLDGSVEMSHRLITIAAPAT